MATVIPWLAPASTFRLATALLSPDGVNVTCHPSGASAERLKDCSVPLLFTNVVSKLNAVPDAAYCSAYSAVKVLAPFSSSDTFSVNVTSLVSPSSVTASTVTL